MGITPGPWLDRIKTKMVEEEGVEVQQGMDGRKAPWWSGHVGCVRHWSRGGGSERMWVTATAPTSSRNETLFF